MRYKLKTASTFEAVSLVTAKSHLHITHSNDDTLIQMLVKSAIKYTENHLGRILADAVYTLYLDKYPDDDIVEITKGPVQSIVSVKYWASETASTATELAASKYELDNAELTARLRFKDSFTYDTDRLNPIEIEFKNGYTEVGFIPDDIVHAICLRVNRSLVNPDNPIEQKLTAADNLLRSYKVKRY